MPLDDVSPDLSGGLNGDRGAAPRLLIAYLEAQPENPFLRGDPNADSQRNIADTIYILTYLFAEGAAPTCLDAADANDDGKVDISDSIMILLSIFGGAGPLPAPFDTCGTDTTTDYLGCWEFPPCGK